MTATLGGTGGRLGDPIHRRRWMSGLGAAVAVLLVAPMLMFAAAAAQGATSLPAPSTDSAGSSAGSSPGGTAAQGQVLLRLNQVIGPDLGYSTQLRVTGSLFVAAGVSVSDLVVRLEVGPALSSRNELATVSDDLTSQRYPYRLDEHPLANVPVPGSSVPFSAEGDVADLGLSSRLSVHPVRVWVLGRINGAALDTIASQGTFLVWSPTVSEYRTPVATVMPIAAPPKLRSDGILTDNSLADDVTPGTGRLSRLLEPLLPLDSQPAPAVALAVDPTLVQALTVMAEGDYRYASPGGPVDLPPSEDARRFLDNLTYFASREGVVFELPYGDTDLPALVRADELDTVVYSINTGRLVLAELLDRDVADTGGIVYPADGLADAPTVDILRANGAGTVILDDRLLPAEPSVSYSPGAAVTLATSGGGEIRALAADHRLTAVASSYTGAEDGPSEGQALARFRAELAMITAEQAEQRLQVLTFPRYWEPPDGWLSAVKDSLHSPYSQPVGLEWPGAGQIAPTPERSGLVHPSWAQERELSTAYVNAVEDVIDEVTVLGSIFCPPTRMTGSEAARCGQRTTAPMKNTLVTGMSTAWRTDPAGGVSISQEVDGRAGYYRSRIRVVASEIVNLTSSSGLVPVTLENDTPWAVTVVLTLSSTDRSRLRSPTEEVRVVDPGQKTQVEIDVDAESAGTFPVDIRLKTVDGRALGPDAAARVLVRSTVYGAIAIAITIGAVSVLFLAVLIRLVRRVRGRGGSGDGAAGTTTAGDVTEPSDATDPPGTSHPPRTADLPRTSGVPWTGDLPRSTHPRGDGMDIVGRSARVNLFLEPNRDPDRRRDGL